MYFTPTDDISLTSSRDFVVGLPSCFGDVKPEVRSAPGGIDCQSISAGGPFARLEKFGKGSQVSLEGKRMPRKDAENEQQIEKVTKSLADEQIITEKKLPRRSFLALAGTFAAGTLAAFAVTASAQQQSDPDKGKEKPDSDSDKAKGKSSDPDKGKTGKSSDPDKAKKKTSKMSKTKTKTKASDPDKGKEKSSDPDKTKKPGASDPDKGK
ncbi:MAG TPA: hypothetical protein VJR23_14495 [Candidatus Acidoferrales bacterium]|nr:hypothetical protein [Candidatus Acidoferrales bacterium]